MYPWWPFGTGEINPYSNFHDLNQDWIIRQMKTNAQDIININNRIDDIIIETSDIVLPSTNDNTDRSTEIMNRLQTTGCCVLGPGPFVIKSTINMPDNTALLGMGNGTVLQLADDSYDDIAVNVGTLCTVSNMTIIGSSSDRICGVTFQADTLEELNRKHRELVDSGRIVGADGNDMMRHDLLPDLAE